MIGFILTGHGGFAGGLYSSIKMIAGEQDELAVVEFHDDETTSDFPQQLRSVISGYAERDDEVIVFCDLQGGTPFNQAMMASAELPNVSVVAGVNLPCMVTAVISRPEAGNAESLIEESLAAGRAGLVHSILPVSSENESSEEDGI
ncbi:MAG: PTS sugar transporter subunit IIA [Olsenella sp.]|jgi:PTS system N-acetylgalactosamine-specific IIA component|nr:PTS sugar transporter subunit IIA [Olsenella sp.]MCH3957280.1 PTS sugar transporter subunit IIA [Olsenella sp.]